MHEMSLVRSVVDIVLEHAEKAGATEVKSVELVIGYGRDIVEDLMTGLFDRLAEGTVAEHAVINMQRVPITVECNRCGCVFPINLHREDTWSCPSCGARLDYKLRTGMEFHISSIEIAGGGDPAAA